MVTLHQSNESHMKLEWHISTVGGREKTNKQKNWQPRILYPKNLSFIHEREIKALPDKQN